jgi:hypothetical protein
MDDDHFTTPTDKQLSNCIAKSSCKKQVSEQPDAEMAGENQLK